MTFVAHSCLPLASSCSAWGSVLSLYQFPSRCCDVCDTVYTIVYITAWNKGPSSKGQATGWICRGWDRSDAAAWALAISPKMPRICLATFLLGWQTSSASLIQQEVNPRNSLWCHIGFDHKPLPLMTEIEGPLRRDLQKGGREKIFLAVIFKAKR